jgi:hypothetical protein
LISKAKEEVLGQTYWFRKKYNLAPTDERFLAMTPEDIKYEYLLHLVSEKPDLKVEDIVKDVEADDAWIKQQEDEVLQDNLRELFDKSKLPVVLAPLAPKPTTRSIATAKIVIPSEKDFETI